MVMVWKNSVLLASSGLKKCWTPTSHKSSLHQMPVLAAAQFYAQRSKIAARTTWIADHQSGQDHLYPHHQLVAGIVKKKSSDDSLPSRHDREEKLRKWRI